jgi:flagellar biosynthesis/type III secretory pathway protein FliH
MPNALTINLNKPVTSVNILDNHTQLPDCNYAQNKTEYNRRQDAEKRGEAPLETAFGGQDSERQRQELVQLCNVLKNLVNKFNQLNNEVISKHKEEIAKLSVEIARKILMQKVQKGDYEIESVIEEVLKNAPTHQELVVHLNPEDLIQLQKRSGSDLKEILDGDKIGGIDNIKFASDPNIGRAECLLETHKGIVKSFINEHIERISEALEKMQ